MDHEEDMHADIDARVTPIALPELSVRKGKQKLCSVGQYMPVEVSSMEGNTTLLALSN